MTSSIRSIPRWLAHHLLIFQSPAHCFLLFLFLLLVLIAIDFLRMGRLARVALAWFTFALGCCSLIALLLGAVCYTSSDVLLDHVEPQVIAVATVWCQGGPIYHDVHAPQRYSLLYGPAPYVMEGAFMTARGESIRVAKLPGFLCLIGTFAGLFILLQRETNSWNALLGIAFCAIGLSSFSHDAYWVRGDPLLVFGACCGLLGSRSRSPAASVLITAAAMGICVDAKIHMLVCFLPMLVFLYQRQGLLKVLLCGVLAMLVAAAPFFVLPGISLKNYLTYLALAGKHGLDKEAFFALVQWAAVLAAPLALAITSLALLNPPAFNAWRKRYFSAILALLIGMGLMILPASKEGSGRHHLMPFVPLLAYFFATAVYAGANGISSRLSTRWGIQVASTISATVLLMLTLSGIRNQLEIIRLTRSQQPAVNLMLAEIHQAESNYPGKTISLGYGDNPDTYNTTFYRVELLFHHQPYLIDAVAVMDTLQSKIGLSQATIDAVKTGRIQIWLIPHGQHPFAMHTWYPPKPALFSKAFQAAFAANYELVSQGKFYDVWRYKTAANSFAMTSAAFQARSTIMVFQGYLP